MRIPTDPRIVTASARLPVPSAAQLAWQRSEFAVFVHFTVNTFTGKEWGDGTESPAIFNPTHLDANQWAAAARDAGAKHMVLTAKHHDGFCLWPTKQTDHSVKSSPFRGGRGDVVREFVDACRRHGLKAGLYLSPWDRHEPSYGDSPRYNAFYLAQLRELLTEYGELAEIWFDGACAEGPNGRRQEYDWPAFFALCKEVQPNAVTFGDGGSDVRWVGNERGIAGEENWSTVDPALVRYPGDGGIEQATGAEARHDRVRIQLNHGNRDGTVWRPAECDVSIRPGWFHHPEEDGEVRSVENLVDVYLRSVGRNGFLLLNVPPTPQGLFHPTDVARLAGFRRRLEAIFRDDLANGARLTHGDTSARPGRSLRLAFAAPITFDLIDLREAINAGQRVASFRVSYRSPAGEWAWLVEGQTIGNRRLITCDRVTASELRLDVLSTRDDAAPTICEVGLYRAST
jgi:alpha-L-fucosidase